MNLGSHCWNRGRTAEELDRIAAPGGALEAAVKAREWGEADAWVSRQKIGTIEDAGLRAGLTFAVETQSIGAELSHSGVHRSSRALER